MAAQYDLGGNVFFLIAYILLFPPQVYFGLRYKTWGFSFGTLAGLILEVLGYIARVVMSQESTQRDSYIMYVVCLTIGPAFLSASIYLCLGRIITVYGQHLSRFRPRTITFTFIFADVGALLLQASGGGMATQTDPSTIDRGVDILKVGLGVHLAGIAIFVALSAEFTYAAWSKEGTHRQDFYTLRESPKFKAFLIALATATIAILIRTAYRVVEFSEGMDSEIANDETLFFILEGGMVLVASIGLTVCHPGPTFQGRWPDADFELKLKKREDDRSLYAPHAHPRLGMR